MRHIIIILILLLVKEISGQSLSLKDKVDAAELIFQGKVIADSGFEAPNSTFIYTAEFILIAKEFKGHFSSDTIVVIIQGGRANGILSKWEDTPDYLWNGAECLFFCTPIDPKGFPGLGKKSGYWATIKHIGDGVINFNCGKKLPIGSHPATCANRIFFDDIENDLYKPIEEITGQKRKVLRLDCLEQNASGK